MYKSEVFDEVSCRAQPKTYSIIIHFHDFSSPGNDSFVNIYSSFTDHGDMITLVPSFELVIFLACSLLKDMHILCWYIYKRYDTTKITVSAIFRKAQCLVSLDWTNGQKILISCLASYVSITLWIFFCIGDGCSSSNNYVK